MNLHIVRRHCISWAGTLHGESHDSETEKKSFKSSNLSYFTTTSRFSAPSRVRLRTICPIQTLHSTAIVSKLIEFPAHRGKQNRHFFYFATTIQGGLTRLCQSKTSWYGGFHAHWIDRQPHTQPRGNECWAVEAIRCTKLNLVRCEK